MRSVFLPSPGDPFISRLSFDTFHQFDHRVDEIFVYLNTHIDKAIADYLMDMYEKHPKVRLKFANRMVQHGTALVAMAQESEADTVMFLEDDAYIIDDGRYMERCFAEIESGQWDALGSPRTSSSMDLQRVVSKKFNVDLSKKGDAGVAFWPNFFFCKREDLLRTDLQFNAHSWQRGEYIKEIDWVVEPEGDEPDIRCDTFVWASIQLRALGLRIKDIPQYHSNPHWRSDKREGANIFEPGCPWFHSGSLSGSIYGIMRDDEGKPLALRTLPQVPALEPGWKLPIEQCQSEGEKMEFQRRCSFYLLAWRRYKDEVPSEFGQLYIRAVERIIDQFGLDRSDIEHQVVEYQNLMKL